VSLTTQPFAAFAATAKLPGAVTAWGYNGLGCLGDGTTTSSSKPVSVILPAGVTTSAIAAGAFHNMAITADGLYWWGDGVATPMKVTFPATVTTVIAAAGGMYHSLALTDDGVYAWGGNGSGQLGNGTTTDSTMPVEVIFPSTVTTVSAIAAGSYHSMAITDDGLYTWGDNGGQLGDGTTKSREKPVLVKGLTNIVDVYIRHLRSKIDDRYPQKLIQTVRGIGYMIEAPEKAAERPGAVPSAPPVQQV